MKIYTFQIFKSTSVNMGFILCIPEILLTLRYDYKRTFYDFISGFIERNEQLLQLFFRKKFCLNSTVKSSRF